MEASKQIKKVFVKIHDKYDLSIPNFSEDLRDDLFGDFDGVISEIQNNSTYNELPNVPEIIKVLGTSQFDPSFILEEYQKYNKIEFVKLTDKEFAKRERPFYYIDDDYAYLSIKYLFDRCGIDNLEDHTIKEALQHILLSCAANGQNYLDQFLDIIYQKKKDYGVVMLKSANRKNLLNNYSFIYFLYLNSGKAIELDPRLNVESNPINLSFANNNNYAQFFELFDVLNELNLADDLITRFLRMYHILEYLTYRIKIVSIEEKARERRTFLREIYSVNAQKDNEENYLKKCFETVFSSDIHNIKTFVNFTAGNRRFLEKHFGIKNGAYNNADFLPRVIYRIRCAIVHNKESEFHILISNPKEYQPIIGMIKRLTHAMENVIRKRINEPHNSINYKSSEIKLY